MKIMRKKGKKLRLIIILIMITDNRSISNATLTLEWVPPYKELLPGVPAGIYRHSDTTIMVMTIMTMMVTMMTIMCMIVTIMTKRPLLIRSFFQQWCLGALGS